MRRMRPSFFSTRSGMSGQQANWWLGLGWVLAISAALVVALLSFAIVYETNSPARSVSVPMPSYAAAEGNLAFQTYSARLASDAGTRVSPLEISLARQAYRKDPLAVPALGIVALSMTDEAETDRRRLLLQKAGELSRRSALVGYELIKDAALRRDDVAFFQWLSRSIKTNSKARATYLATLAEATSRDGAVAALVPIVGPAPSWSEAYWRAIVNRPSSLANGARLRIAVTKRPWNLDRVMVTDQQLIQQLVSAGEFDLAQQLVGALRPVPSKSETANLLGEASLARQPDLPPFDWDLTSLGYMGAVVEPETESLAISAIGGARGVAAKRLIYVEPGDYTFGWTLSRTGEALANALSVEVECAESEARAAKPYTVRLIDGTQSVQLMVASGSCRWYWFSIRADISDGSAGFDARLRGLSLARNHT